MAEFYKRDIETVPGERMGGYTVGYIDLDPETGEYLGSRQFGYSIAKHLNLNASKKIVAKELVELGEMNHRTFDRSLGRQIFKLCHEGDKNRQEELSDLIACRTFLNWWQSLDGVPMFSVSPNGLEFDTEDVQEKAYGIMQGLHSTPSNGLTFKEGMDNNWSCQQGPWNLSVLGPMIGTDSKAWYWRIYLTLPSKQVILFASHGDYDVNAYASRAEAEADMLAKWNDAKSNMGV